MMTFIILIHVVVCFVLITLVLIQRGRGSGLVESFQGVESMFGTKTNAFLTRTTTVLSILFFITCLSLAVLSVRQSRSLLSNVRSESKPIKLLPVSTGQPPVQAQQPQAKTAIPAAQNAPLQQLPQETKKAQ